MPSPFPGMDPYLEHPEFFPDLHDRFIVHLSEALQSRLPPSYFAIGKTRSWIEYTQRTIEPDVGVFRDEGPSKGGTHEAASGIAVQPIVVFTPQLEVREPFLEIRSIQGERLLVTCIEVLSPNNKTGGDDGRGLYLKKQRELVASKVNIVEIDLLRGGMHTTLVPLESLIKAVGRFDYHVCVRQMDELQEQRVHPIRLEDRLPEVLIPLLPGDSGVVVDLQAVFDRCYDLGPYRFAVPYRRAPVPPLTPQQASWAEEKLRERGLLSQP